MQCYDHIITTSTEKKHAVAFFVQDNYVHAEV